MKIFGNANEKTARHLSNKIRTYLQCFDFIVASESKLTLFKNRITFLKLVQTTRVFFLDASGISFLGDVFSSF